MKKSHLRKLIKEVLREAEQWQGWGDITSGDREEFKTLLVKLKSHIANVYSKQLASTKLFLLDKAIKNLDNTDPSEAARPFARFSMEDRLSISDFIVRYGNDGTERVWDLLYSLCQKDIEGYKAPKYDIELKGISDISWPNGSRKGDVFITGLEDSQPGINFGFGEYTLDKEFIEKFSRPGSQLWLDHGQKIKLTNMSDVMKKVQEALEKYYNS